MTKKTQSEVFVLHYQQKMLTSDIVEENIKYRLKHSRFWKRPKYMYSEKRHAKNAIMHFPKILQDQIEIVRYVPEYDSGIW